MQHYIEKIFTAPVYDVATKTPLDAMPRLSDRIGHNVLCKREDLQPVFSFKLRGAYTKMYRLSTEERARGVICASAGNHAQGVALSANRLGMRAVIVMPVTTPQIKIDAVRRLGGAQVEIVLHGDFYDAASQHARELQETHGYTYIHPFDDPDVIAGQGTIALEILTQHPHHIDAIFVPCGGGGLLAGIAVLVKALRPDIKIIGVEPEDAASMTTAVRGGKRQTLDQVGIFADGVAVKMPGELTFELIKQHVDDFVTVSTDEICAAMKDLFDDTRAIAEPSGAVAAAGIKKWAAQQDAKNLTLINIVSGANMNFDRLRYVAERTEIGEQREGLLAVTIPEIPGTFLNFCTLLGTHNVTEFSYRYQSAARAQIFVGVERSRPTRSRHRKTARARLRHRKPDRQRTRQIAPALHDRRREHGGGGRAHLPLRLPRTPRRADALPANPRHKKQHQPLSLPQSRQRLRPRPRRHPEQRPGTAGSTPRRHWL